ncbi:MAG: hypothetical protein IKK52_07030 [Alphaproteobacteria bacterium]|nr:hypothetical protein [Alphaproteobacteria bacterium]
MKFIKTLGKSLWGVASFIFKLIKLPFVILLFLGGLSSDTDNDEATISDYNTGRTLFKIKNNRVDEYSTGRTLYKINGNYFEDAYTGRILYKLDNDYIDDYSIGRSLYKIKDNYIEEYGTGNTLYRIRDNYIEDYSTGRTLYKVDGKITAWVIITILIYEGVLER